MPSEERPDPDQDPNVNNPDIDKVLEEQEPIDDDTFGLANVLRQIGAEIHAAEAAAESSGAKTIAWTGGSVELDLDITKKATGGLSIKVVTLGGEYDKDKTTKITVALAPYSADGTVPPPRVGLRAMDGSG